MESWPQQENSKIPPEEDIISGKIDASKEVNLGNPEDFLDAEQEILSCADRADSDNEGDSVRSRLRKAVLAVTAGAMLISATPAFAGRIQKDNMINQENIEHQIQELQNQKYELAEKERNAQEEQRIQELTEHTNKLNIEGLSIGDVELSLRCPCEQYGVYVNGNHLGDIYSEGFQFSKEEFSQDLHNLLAEHNIFEQSSDVYINIDNKASDVMNSWGWSINNNELDFGSDVNIIKLNSDGKTESIEIRSNDNDGIVITVTDRDGTVVTLKAVGGKFVEGPFSN